MKCESYIAAFRLLCISRSEQLTYFGVKEIAQENKASYEEQYVSFQMKIVTEIWNFLFKK